MPQVLGQTSAAEMNIIFAGIPLVSKGSDEHIKIERPAPDVESVAGNDGDIVVGLNLDDRHLITLSFLVNSPANAILNAIRQGDRARKALTIAPFLCTERVSGNYYQAGQCYIKSMSEITRSNTPGNQQWVLECASMVVVFGPFSPIP